MAILEKEVWISLNGKNIKYWEDKGYIIPRRKNNGKFGVAKGTKIKVKVDDLSKGCMVKVTKVCDNCGVQIKNQSYNTINTARNKTDGKDRCRRCGYTYESNMRKHNSPYEKSLEYYAIRNDKKYLLDEYSDKNEDLPCRVNYVSTQKVWWNCPKCKSKYRAQIDSRTNMNSNCPYCAGYKVNSTNCLWTTHHEIAERLKDKSLGYKITKGAHKKVTFICPDCKYTYNRSINHAVTRGCSCPKCGDGISYPEKFMTNILDQLIKQRQLDIYIRQMKFNDHELGNRKYDFYIQSKRLIVETNGVQHKKGGFVALGGRTAKEEQENDELKRRIAQEKFHIKYYIFIDCEKSEKYYIKNSILNSELASLFDLSKIDWEECAKFALSSIVAKACYMYNSVQYKYPCEIAKELNLHEETVKRYLKRGAEAGITNYGNVASLS